jgi:ATP-binding cassette subfamily B multidrug efflux pump
MTPTTSSSSNASQKSPARRASGSQPLAQSGAEDKLRAFHEEDAIIKSYDLLLLKRLLPFVRPHLRYLVISFGALLLMAGFGLLRPLVMGRAVAHASERQAAALFNDGLLLTGLIVVGQLISFAQMYAMQMCGAYSMADLRAHIFSFMQRLPLRFFDRTPVGRLVTRATNDVDAVSELFATGVLNAMGDLVSLIGIVIAMVLLDWKLALIAFAALPFVGILVYFIRRGSKRAYRDIRTKTARLNAFLNEQVGGIAVVQAYAREEAMAREFDAINSAYRDANKRAIYYEAVLDAAIEMISTLCIASVLWWVGVQRLGHSPVSFALVVTFTQYIRQFFEPVSMLSQRYTVLQSSLSGAERIFQLLDEKDVEDQSPAAVKAANAAVSAAVKDPELALALEDVTFEYKPGVPVLKNVTLAARRGEKIALVGATGAGKSTVASMLLRLYQPQAGRVLLMGRDVRTYKRQELRELLSVVPQDVFLFAGTVLSNIAMGEQSPDAARAESALRRIDAWALFERRGGLGATVNERGSNFSAGERQLLSFARALYHDAPILILDEATASVDSDTEARLQRALDVVMRERTALIIAHRLSTIQAADRIIVFHKGCVIEAGTHAELLEKGGIYARLYRLQFAA